MSTTFAAPRLSPLDELPWVEMNGNLGQAFEEFATAADTRIAKRNAPRRAAVIVQPARERIAVGGLPQQFGDREVADQAAFKALECAQESPLIESEAEDKSYLEAMSGYAPPVAKPLPIE